MIAPLTRIDRAATENRRDGSKPVRSGWTRLWGLREREEMEAGISARGRIGFEGRRRGSYATAARSTSVSGKGYEGGRTLPLAMCQLAHIDGYK